MTRRRQARRAEAMPRVPGRNARVSDHALLRWMEQVLEIDVDAVRAVILTDVRRAAIESGASAIRCRAEDVTLVVKGGVVTTVLTGAQDRIRRGQG